MQILVEISKLTTISSNHYVLLGKWGDGKQFFVKNDNVRKVWTVDTMTKMNISHESEKIIIISIFCTDHLVACSEYKECK